MHILHPLEYLLHVPPDLPHSYVLLFCLMLLNDLFKISATELEYEILRGLPLIVLGVVYVEQLNNIGALFEPGENLEFSTNIIACLGRPLNCHGLFVCPIVGLEHVT